jgi:subtilisin family serine protease
MKIRTQLPVCKMIAAFTSILLASSSIAQQLPPQAALNAFQQDKSALTTNSGLNSIPNSILVKFQRNSSAQARNQTLAAVGASRVRDLDLVEGLVHIRTQAPLNSVLAALSANPQVEFAEPDYVVNSFASPNDLYFERQWGLLNDGQQVRQYGTPGADIRVIPAWEISKGEEGCLVAVIDTGVQWNHPDLAANIWRNSGETLVDGLDNDNNGFIDDAIGWDFFSNDNDPDDEHGHGTHVSGTVAALTDNGIGVAGVAPNCKIMPLRFLGPNGGSTADAIAALNYAVKAGAKISNNSWGGGNSSTALYQAIQAAGAAGHIFVAAAGNSSFNTDRTPQYPAGYNLQNIISVAATDNQDRLATFSNYGAKTVDLGAPGVDIISLTRGSDYRWASGTSMAAPHVAGVVALVSAKYPNLSALEVIEQILSTTRFVSSLNRKTVTGGVLDAHKALTAGFNVEPTPDPEQPPEDPPVTEEPAVTVPATPASLTAASNSPGNVTLNWSDVSNETGFQIQREKRNNGGKWGSLTLFDAAANQTSMSDASGAGTFRYRISASNSAGSSAWSAWVEVTVSK